jgi:hypothetical protein
MRNYQQIVVYTPKTDISELYWEVKVSRKTFYCGELIALNEVKQLCPNIKCATVENFTDDLNRNKIDVNNYHFGVIYVKM